MNEHETTLLAEVREAMQADEVRLNIVRTFSHGGAIRIESRPYHGRWKAIKTLIFPPEGGTLADSLATLAEMRTEVPA